MTVPNGKKEKYLKADYSDYAKDLNGKTEKKMQDWQKNIIKEKIEGSTFILGFSAPLLYAATNLPYFTTKFVGYTFGAPFAALGVVGLIDAINTYYRYKNGKETPVYYDE